MYECKWYFYYRELTRWELLHPNFLLFRCKWYIYYRELDRARTFIIKYWAGREVLHPKYFARILLILLLQRNGQSENFFTVNFLFGCKWYFFITENWAEKKLLRPKFVGRNNQIYFNTQLCFIYTVQPSHFEPSGETQNTSKCW